MNKELLNLDTALSYEAPFAEIVEIVIEGGFAISPVCDGTDDECLNQ
ncbi:MAG: hypothetical protein LBT04_05670 [Prevotellaceae bacterium]|jgi:hypothetical protein|nr:hypothetical protein [Prevotellaceae bacterium]